MEGLVCKGSQTVTYQLCPFHFGGIAFLEAPDFLCAFACFFNALLCSLFISLGGGKREANGRVREGGRRARRASKVVTIK